MPGCVSSTVGGAPYTASDLENLYVQNGGSPALATVMAAIAIVESGGGCSSGGCFAYSESQCVNTNGTTDNGLWQINSSNNPNGLDTSDPNVNASLAVQLAEHTRNGLSNWVTYQGAEFQSVLSAITGQAITDTSGGATTAIGNNQGGAATNVAAAGSPTFTPSPLSPAIIGAIVIGFAIVVILVIAQRQQKVQP